MPLKVDNIGTTLNYSPFSTVSSMLTTRVFERFFSLSFCLFGSLTLCDFLFLSVSFSLSIFLFLSVSLSHSRFVTFSLTLYPLLSLSLSLSLSLPPSLISLHLCLSLCVSLSLLFSSLLSHSCVFTCPIRSWDLIRLGLLPFQINPPSNMFDLQPDISINNRDAL